MRYLKKVLGVVAICAIFYILFKVALNTPLIINEISINKLMILIAIIMTFLIIHIVRMFRIYILLIENKMQFREFAKIYLKTTLVNNVIPFKLGEFYKMICYGEKLNSLSAGVSLVWIDRFFDSIILLILMLIAAKGNIFSPVFIILVAFIIFSILAYLSFESTYKYFNTLVLEKGTSKRSKIYLEGIEELKKLYKNAKNMLSYRGATLIVLSIIIWIFEYLIAFLTIKLLFGMEFGLNIFTNYINGAFMLFNNEFANIFNFNVVIMIVIFAIIMISFKIRKMGERNE